MPLALPADRTRSRVRWYLRTSLAAMFTYRSVATTAWNRSGRRLTSGVPVSVPIDSVSRTTLSLPRYWRRNSVTSMASATLQSKVISPLPALPLRPRVLPAPRWSHWTTVKCCSQDRRGRVKTALGQPGPPCKTSSTGLSRSSPRSWIHWSIPPTLMNRCSTIPLGVSITSALATRRWRALRQANPPTAGAAMMPAAPPTMVPIMAAPQGPQRCLVLLGGSKRVPLQGLCPEPGSFPGLAWQGDGFGILSRAVESIGS
jgi:hypothetical protein